MPTYEFRCPDGTVIERIFKMSEVPATIPSPNGDGDAVRMISGGAGLVFKGSGFYITDYGKDGKKDQRDAAKSTESTKTTVPAAAPAASTAAPAASTPSTSTPSST
jgi:predicted nucleic acid-binding Zn ribbon protein